MPSRPVLIRIHPDDNVAVAVEDIEKGADLHLEEVHIKARNPIPRGHKVALAAIAAHRPVVKYGYPIGEATKAIKAGEHVHLHNLRTRLDGLLEYTWQPSTVEKRTEKPATFEGYLRPDGQVGIRNEIWIIPTVGCVNKVCERLAGRSMRTLVSGPLEGVYYFQHPYGCSQLGDDMATTQKLLAGLVRHPNAAGVLIVGLGCENNNLDVFRQFMGDIDPRRVRAFSAQQVEDELERGLALLEELADYARMFRRTTQPASKLKIGLKCGGSDGFSGITANPLLGAISDRFVAMGGTTLLTEVPEMFGAETILMNRCADRATFEKCVRLINDFKSYFLRHNQPIYENPAPGNKDGGITTLEDKSLGCTQKGGTSAVTDVLEYGQAATRAGLNLVQAPGNDMVSVSALTAAGAHMVLFTTGRGTPLGGPVPTVKLSTTSELARLKKSWIDFDAGVLLDGKPMAELASELLAFCLDIASGRRRTRNEHNDFREIAIFKDGVTV
jgi:altronate hydrolase